jgi:hypothetical protein
MQSMTPARSSASRFARIFMSPAKPVALRAQIDVAGEAGRASRAY